MRYPFVVERDKESTKLGLQFVGLNDRSKPTVIIGVVSGSLVDVVNKWIISTNAPRQCIQVGDIIVSANGCFKEKDGADMMRMVLRGDPLVMLAMHREDYCLWGPSPPALPPLAARPPRPAARGYRRTYDVDPRNVRFTHDYINSCFRSGTELDDAIERLLNGEMRIESFPPLEV